MTEGHRRWPATLLLVFLLLGVLLLRPGLGRGAGHQPLLPQTYSADCDVRGWWMSEKLDGVRGYWDGRQLWSKNGRQLQAPPEFCAALPPFAVEGELWGGRGTFEKTAATVRRQPGGADWLHLQLAIFDVPAVAGEFQQRIAVAQRWFEQHPSRHAFVIAQLPVLSSHHLHQHLDHIQQLGGEGLIVRDPTAHYAAGRSPTILKVKKTADAEARVIAHLPGQGKNSRCLGALLVELEDGRRFKIGSGFSAAERLHPPAVGTIITFRHYGCYDSGIPKFPVFLRPRHDAGL